MRIPFITGEPGKQGRFPENFYIQGETPSGRMALVGRPGLLEWCDTGESEQIRGMIEFDGNVYAVGGYTVYQIDSDGNATALSAILDTERGMCWMAHNGVHIMLTDGVYGYIIADSAGTMVVTRIADADFPVPSSLAYIDGYFVVSSADTGRFYISGLYDGISWDALDYATASGSPDDLRSVMVDHRELWCFGNKTVEVYYNSGDASFPFARIEGAFSEKGCGASASPAKLDNNVYWLTNEGQIVRSEGYQPVVISTREIEDELAGYATLSDAIGLSINWRGHAFYVLAFPTAGKTWALDTTTGLWSRFSSYSEYKPTPDKWRANCYTPFGRLHLVGDFENGKIYKLDSDTYTDNSEEIKHKLFSPPVLSEDRTRLFHTSLEVEFKTGVGLVTGDGSDPQVMLRWSDDDCRTWSQEYHRSIGKTGEYKVSVAWNRLGASRNRVYEVSVSDPVEVVIYDAYLDAQKGVS